MIGKSNACKKGNLRRGPGQVPLLTGCVLGALRIIKIFWGEEQKERLIEMEFGV